MLLTVADVNKTSTSQILVLPWPFIYTLTIALILDSSMFFKISQQINFGPSPDLDDIVMKYAQ